MRIGMQAIPATLVLILALSLFPGNVSARELFSFDLAADFATGDYGTGQSTDTYSTSVILGYYPSERLDFSLSASYFYQSSRATTSTGGMFFGRRQESETANGSSGPRFGPGATTTDEGASRNGFGDLYASGGFKLLTEKKQRPEIKVVGYVKLPTADEDEGLGTGETDYSIGVEGRKWVDLWHPHARATMVFQGDNDTLQLEDFYTYEAGLGYLLNQDLLADFSIWGATEPADGAGSQAEARLKFTKWNKDNTGLTFYISAGLVEESHDFGAGGAYFVNF